MELYESRVYERTFVRSECSSSFISCPFTLVKAIERLLKEVVTNFFWISTSLPPVRAAYSLTQSSMKSMILFDVITLISKCDFLRKSLESI